ncbi:unnamed protein product [Parajaminaea phylloscopi]
MHSLRSPSHLVLRCRPSVANQNSQTALRALAGSQQTVTRSALAVSPRHQQQQKNTPLRLFATSIAFRMPSSDPSKTNGSGLTPEQSKQLPTRAAREDEHQIIQGLRDLYSSAPTTSSYDMYTQNAVFHDPVSIAQGVKSIKAQFNALPALFPRAVITKFDLLETPKTLPEKTILIDQVVDYYRKQQDPEPFKSLNSLLTIKREAGGAGLVTDHIEEWDHKAETDESNSGFFGQLNEMRKKTLAKLTEAMADQTPPTER